MSWRVVFLCMRKRPAMWLLKHIYIPTVYLIQINRHKSASTSSELFSKINNNHGHGVNTTSWILANDAQRFAGSIVSFLWFGPGTHPPGWRVPEQSAASLPAPGTITRAASWRAHGAAVDFLGGIVPHNSLLSLQGVWWRRPRTLPQKHFYQNHLAPQF